MNKVQDILREVAANPFKTNQAIDQALKDLYVLIEGVIGEDDKPNIDSGWEARNRLKNYQRRILKELFGENNALL